MPFEITFLLYSAAFGVIFWTRPDLEISLPKRHLKSGLLKEWKEGFFFLDDLAKLDKKEELEEKSV